MQMKRLLFMLFGCTMFTLVAITTGCKNKKGISQKENPSDSQMVTTENQSGNNNENTMEQPKPETPKTNVKVKITTSQGEMIVLLYDETPLHRDNFIKLVETGYYNDLLFHRCIRNFMVQGGDPNSRGAAQGQQLGIGGPGYTVDAEFNSKFIHKKGALAAARQGDAVNPGKKSSGSQFYIVQGSPCTDAQIEQYQRYVQQKNPGFTYTDEQKAIYKTLGGTAQLDMDYTVFGEVIQGLEVIDAIAAQPTAMGDRPVTDVKMTMEIIK
jgi:peptidyl-prolyl cis-trans isomerase B (cyclophilin B)